MIFHFCSTWRYQRWHTYWSHWNATKIASLFAIKNGEKVRKIQERHGFGIRRCRTLSFKFFCDCIWNGFWNSFFKWKCTYVELPPTFCLFSNWQHCTPVTFIFTAEIPLFSFQWSCMDKFIQVRFCNDAGCSKWSRKIAIHESKGGIKSLCFSAIS